MTPDLGCRLHPSCLACPLDRCHYEDPRAFLRRRAAEMADLRRQGRRNREIAIAFGVSVRTVQRALKAAKSGSNGTTQCHSEHSEEYRGRAGKE